MNVCESALFAGLEQVKPGVRLSDISHAIEEYLTKNARQRKQKWSEWKMT